MMRFYVINTFCFLYPFALAFRIVAWQAIYHGERVTKLGPLYHCPTCVLPKKDLPKGCPECALTETFDYFKQRIITEAHKRYGKRGTEAEWPFDFPLMDVLETYAGVRRMFDENGEQINPTWDYTIAALARLIQSERSQHTAVKLYELQ